LLLTALISVGTDYISAEIFIPYGNLPPEPEDHPGRGHKGKLPEKDDGGYGKQLAALTMNHAQNRTAKNIGRKG